MERKERVELPHQIVTDRMIAAIKEGTLPWRKPWTVLEQANLISQRGYRGINTIMTNLIAQVRGYEEPWWLTINQTNNLGSRVKRGEKATPLIFWKRLERKEEESDGEAAGGGRKVRQRPRFMLRYYNVFNVAQVEQSDPLRAVLEKVTPIERIDRTLKGRTTDARAEALVKRYLDDKGPKYQTGGNVAAYTPALDRVAMPPKRQFESAAFFHSTRFHELTHSTGHSSRLDRFTNETVIPAQGEDDYSREELVAEFGASFCCAIVGIDCPEVAANSASYLAHWVKQLEENPEWLVQASGKAQRAVDLIRTGKLPTDEAEAA